MWSQRTITCQLVLSLCFLGATQAWAADTHGFRITATTDQSVYHSGDTVTVYVTAENPLDQTVRIVGQFNQFERFGKDEVWSWPDNVTVGGSYAGALGAFSDFGPNVSKFQPFYEIFQPGNLPPYPRINLPPHSLTVFARTTFNQLTNSIACGLSIQAIM